MPELFVFNGVNAVSGTYLLPAMSPAEISGMARGRLVDSDDLKELRWWHHRVSESSFGPKEGIDARQLSQAGWGVIFAHDADPAVREALGELLDHRQRQAQGCYREFARESGYRPGESKQDFLARQGAAPGPADPDVVPYYLLIVGAPQSIPYSFQHQLDVQYAVGRLHFDRVGDYASYAHSVVAAEKGQLVREPHLQLFATRNPDDSSTHLSASELASPLATTLSAVRPDWKVQACIGADATKSQLSDLIHGPTTPALLFTATHGVGFPSGHPRQLREQGALLCQDWPGPAAQSQALLEEQYFAAADVGSQARLGGLIAFHFACFGAGTPRWDEFASGTEPSRSEVAPNAFVASLPKRLLAHEGGGALAVISHVDRAWGYSFLWPQAGRQTESYVSCLKRLLAGHPVGSAMEYFNLRYAELSSDLSRELDDVRFGKRPDHGVLAGLWTANNDARNVTVLGDPAVRLAVEPAFLGPVRAVQREVSPSPLIPPRTRPEIDEEVRPAPALTSALISPSPSPSPREPAEVDFGLLDGIRQARERLTSTLQGVAQSLGAALERAVDDVTVLEVATYTSDDISSTAYDHATGRFGEHARLRALTRVGIGGNTELLVAEQRDDVDERVWALHASMVQEARQTRVELLKATGATVAGLVDVLRGV